MQKINLEHASPSKTEICPNRTKKRLWTARVSLALAILMLSAQGCSRHVLVFSEQSKKGDKDVISHVINVPGWGTPEALNVAKVCGNATNLVRLEREIKFKHWFFAFWTWSLYSPSTITVYCRGDRLNPYKQPKNNSPEPSENIRTR